MKEILNDRIYDSTKECLILWDGYGTPQRVPEEKVNDVATDVYNQARRMTKSNMFVTVTAWMKMMALTMHIEFPKWRELLWIVFCIYFLGFE